MPCEDSCGAGRSIVYHQADLATRVMCMLSQVQMVKDIQQASRQLNKRQMTWFRDDPMYQWLDAKQPTDALVQQIVESVGRSEHVGKLSCQLHMFICVQGLQLCCHAGWLGVVSVCYMASTMIDTLAKMLVFLYAC